MALKEKRPPKTAAELAVEIADAMLGYHSSRADYRKQERYWEEVKKATAKYRLAKSREEKYTRRGRTML
jgi:hypothetical protein